MGLGSFGGGVGAARYLAGHGAQVTVTDQKSGEELSDSVKALDGLGIRFVLGRHEFSDFTGADMVVVSPGVPGSSEFVEAARRAGVILTTEIGLFVERCPARICGITGSNGKTTTVSMIKSILEHTGERFRVGGNIGGSLLSELQTIASGDHVVLELSSFQLEWLDRLSWSPHIAAVLNIMPNHLDRHGSFNDYLRAKAAILDHQTPDDMAILMDDDQGSASLSYRVRGLLVWVGTDLTGEGITLEGSWIAEHIGNRVNRICDTGALHVPGKHNVLNAMAAAACAREMHIGYDSIRSGLGAYKGLPHRLEFAGEHNGIQFYNDSKATTPEAAAAGITSFNLPVIPILGGYDKGVSFGEMARRIAPHVAWAALIGVTAPEISRELEKAGVHSAVFASLEEAFTACCELSSSGDVVILSPGCASYDMFNNYEERGNAFKELVRRLINSQH